MHADEVDFDAALIAERFPGRPVREVEPAGTDNRLFRIGDELVARVPVHEPSVAAFRREAQWLPFLAARLPLRVPELVEVFEPGAFPFPWAVYRWIDGAPASGCEPEELAAFLTALWEIETDGAPPAGRGAPLERRDTDTVRAAVAEVGATEIWAAAVAAPAWAGPPRWLHGDLDARNLLTRAGTLHAVLDWGCTGIGDPACDVGAAWKLLDASSRETFRDALQIDDATWARARGWVASQAALAATYYTEETNPTLLREARRWLAAVQSDCTAI